GLLRSRAAAAGGPGVLPRVDRRQPRGPGQPAAAVAGVRGDGSQQGPTETAAAGLVPGVAVGRQDAASAHAPGRRDRLLRLPRPAALINPITDRVGVLLARRWLARRASEGLLSLAGASG